MSTGPENGVAPDPPAGITVVRGGLLPFLRSVAGNADWGPADPRGLCLLSGGIVAGNLRRRLAVEGLGTDLVARSTIEDLAADLVATANDRPVRVLDPPVRKRLVEAILTEAADHDTPLGRFARRVSFEGGDVLDGVVAELDEYYRCTDAGRDRDQLATVVEAVAGDHPYAADRTRESTRAFAAADRLIANRLLERNEDAPDRAYRSRSHLVAAARDVVGDAWEEVTGDPEWVAVATVSALDDPTLRLLARIAAETPLVVFAGAGTADPFGSRIDAALSETGIPVREATEESVGEPVASLLSAATGHATAAPSGVETVAVPDRRREVEYAVRAARRREGSTLLVAPDAAEYATPLRDVALTRNCPFHVETRREVRPLPAFRGVTATARLATAATSGTVAPRDLLEPLELEMCPPTAADTDAGDDHDETWPLPAAILRELTRVLSRRGREQSLAAIRSTLADAGGDFGRVEAFLSWIDDVRSEPPDDGESLEEFVSTVLSAHVATVRERPIRSIVGVAVDTGRARVDASHPAEEAQQVRRAATTAARTYDWLVDSLDRPATWETALAALRQAGGSETYGRSRTDADAVEVVDAGNAYFRRADTVFVLALSADRFPRTPRGASFLHPAVRAAVGRRREEFPYLYLDGETTQYERDLDAYEAALRVARESVVLVRPYKDDEGRDVAPSPFVDALSVPDRRHTRVDIGDWIALGGGPDRRTESGRDGAPPEAANGDGSDGDGDGGDGGDGDASAWDDLWGSLSEKERLRALSFYANQPPGDRPAREALWRLADWIDGGDAPGRVIRRRDRFRTYGEDDDE